MELIVMFIVLFSFNILVKINKKLVYNILYELKFYIFEKCCYFVCQFNKFDFNINYRGNIVFF